MSHVSDPDGRRVGPSRVAHAAAIALRIPEVRKHPALCGGDFVAEGCDALPGRAGQPPSRAE